jgi:hypothetical protein
MDTVFVDRHRTMKFLQGKVEIFDFFCSLLFLNYSASCSQTIWMPFSIWLGFRSGFKKIRLVHINILSSVILSVRTKETGKKCINNFLVPELAKDRVLFFRLAHTNILIMCLINLLRDNFILNEVMCEITI